MRGVLTLIMMLGLAGAAGAQVAVGTFGDWTLRCTATGIGQTSCNLNQTVISNPGRSLMADVELSRMVVSNAPRALLVVYTPQNLSLTVPASYTVDGAGERVELSWRTCNDGTCRAAVLLTPQQEAALKAGGRMLLSYRPIGANESIAFPVSLSGVTAGLNALSQQ